MAKRYDETIEVTPDPRSGRSRCVLVARSPLRHRRTPHDVARGAGSGGRRPRPEERDVLPGPRPALRVALATGELDADGFLITSCSAVYDIYRDRLKGDWQHGPPMGLTPFFPNSAGFLSALALQWARLSSGHDRDAMGRVHEGAFRVPANETFGFELSRDRRSRRDQIHAGRFRRTATPPAISKEE